MPSHYKNGKKNGKKNGNGKKKTMPVKPPAQRRSKDQTEKKIRDVTKKLEPNDSKLARKIITEPSFRKKLGNAFLTGLTFGLYKP
tara:strand:- start:522 stop:776 length:255 start_codon:yes stop_codon:yes gene_type:complete